MKIPALVGSFLLSVGIATMGCQTGKKGLGSGEPDSGASQGGAGSGGSATSGTVGTGGSLGQGGSSVPGQGGSGGSAGSDGSVATGGSGGGAGGEGAGGATAFGGVAGGSSTSGSTATGGVAGGTHGGSTGSDTGGARSGGTTGSGTGGTQTGGSTGSGSGGTRTGGSTGSSGSGTGGRGTGGVATGGANGGTGGISAGGVGGAAGSGGGSSGLGGSIGHASCEVDADCTGTNSGYKCCNHLCSNTQNDILNCGGCGTKCSGSNPYCGGGGCTTPPCQGTSCASDSTCCGNQCCGAGKLCCTVNMGPSVIGCYDPVDGTCPTGCAICVCASPDTPIATPQGDQPIAELRVGDWVYSVDRGQIRPVPIKRINRQSVFPSHTMVNLRLASGRTLLISPLHPTADGRMFRDLARGDLLDGVAIVEAGRVAYDQPFTYDILPDSDSGAYFAASVLIGSTLAPPTAQPLASPVLPAPANYVSVR